MKEYGATLIITIGVITLLTTGVFSGTIYSLIKRAIKDIVNDALSMLNIEINEIHEKYCEAERLTCTRKCSKRRTGSELISFKLEQVGMTAWQEEQKRIDENTKAVEKANKDAAGKTKLISKDYLREIEEDVENYHPEHTNDQEAIDRDFMQEISTVVENVAKSTDLPFNDDEDNNNEPKE